MDIVIETDKATLVTLEPLKEHSLTYMVSDRFSGARELAEVLIALTPASLAAVTAVVVQLIRSKRHVRIITKKVRLEGLSEEAALEILKTLAALSE